MKKISQYFCLFLLVSLALACYKHEASPEDVAKRFTVALFKGNTDELFTLLYFPDDIKKQSDVDNILKGKTNVLVQQSKKSADEKGGLRGVKTIPAVFNKDRTKAKVSIIAKFKNGAVNKQVIHLIKQNGKWLIFLKQK